MRSALKRPKIASWIVLALVALVAGSVIAIAPLRWRAQVVALTAAGQIPDIEWMDVLAFLSPRSPQSLARLIDTRNPYAVIRNPRSSPLDLDAGAELFRARCTVCHAPDGGGTPMGPALFGREFTHGVSDWAVFRTIRSGVPAAGMPAHPLSETELWQLVGYVGTLDVAGRTAMAPSDRSSFTVKPVPYEELRATVHPTRDWLTYSGSYSGQRHSALTQITPDNVGRLAVRWIHQFPVKGRNETSPIVRDGVMFVTSPPGHVAALDAASGKVRWTYDITTTSHGGHAGPVNRGAAIMGDKVFVPTSDGRLFALSMASGSVVWQVRIVAGREEGYRITGAPLTYRDLVVTGVRTDSGGRGFLVAYEADTGKERWRFFTIPAPGERGHETWAGDSWRNGGATTWLTGSYDAEQDLLIWGVGNPKPDYDATVREGDNLYSNSVVALRGTTGERVWHFQFTPGDDHDWDSAQIPVLADRRAGEKIEKHLLWANRNGFYYVLDRPSGRFLTATPFVRQNWAARIDERGRPVRRVESAPTPQGVLTYPGNTGGTNWWSPTYDSSLDLFFVPALEQGLVFFRARREARGDASSQSAPSARAAPFYTAVRALAAGTGRLVWEYRREPRRVDPEMGGLLSTKTGLVFGGDQGTFFALDSRSGRPLWSFSSGGHIAAAPVTYMVNGEQFVAIATGGDLVAFALPPGPKPVVGAVPSR